MTPANEVIMYDENQRLHDAFFTEITDHGYSRLPVFSGNRNNVQGILYVKDLLVEDDHISLKQTEEALETTFLTVRGSDLLDGVLGKMLKAKQHLAIVQNRNKQFLGVISLEDIIEEIIQQEIEDEGDEEGV